MNVVLDTNVLVSALWTPNGKAAYILNSVLTGKLNICHDYRILEEYRNVLNRPKFHFQQWQINYLLDTINRDGFSIVPSPITNIPFTDESDRKFLEVAVSGNAILVTGNLKHYPFDPCIMPVADFYDLLIS